MEPPKPQRRRWVDPFFFFKIFIGIIVGGALVLWGVWSLTVSALKIILPEVTH